ncbi:hypothetical protein [Gordonia hirsuta]|nr:hypothetical protein [Gordonia hirsuta]
MVITTAHSRVVVGRMIPTCHTADLPLGMGVLLQVLGAVPRRLIRTTSPVSAVGGHAEGVGAFPGTLATTLLGLEPYDPESNGVVERRNGFFETSFMPGRDFSSPTDFNARFTEWLTTANARVVGRSSPNRST